MNLQYENGTLIYLQVKSATKNQETPPVVFAKTNVDKAILHKEKNDLCTLVKADRPTRSFFTWCKKTD